MEDKPLHIGQSVRRVDLVDKVTGVAKYCLDLTIPGVCFARIVRSNRAHARLLGIEADDARAHPGVVAVVTGSDLGGLFPRFGHIVADHEILARDKVRFYGEPVAIIVGESLAAAIDAADLVEVTYDDLPPVMTASEALEPGAPLLHEELPPDSIRFTEGGAMRASGQYSPRSNNVVQEFSLEWGDVDSAWGNAAAVVESRVSYPMLYAYAMEPYNALAFFHDGRLEVDSTCQHPFMVRDDLARIFSLPLSAVTVRAPYIGGGYGSKSYTKVEPLAAVASWKTGRPVKLALDVEDAIYTTRADSASIRVKSALDAEGRFLAREFDIVLDSGAYADNSPLVIEKCVNRCFGPYRIPNLKVRGRAVYTNTTPASSYRGFGAPQGVFAGETNLEQLAEDFGIDSLELRRRNLVHPGEEILPGARGIDADLAADLEMLASSLERNKPDDTTNFATAVACSASDAGALPISSVIVRVESDGSIIVLSGSAEMGQGSRSVLTQIAAEEFGVALNEVTVRQSDTSLTSYERTTGASRTTTVVGLALQRACSDARSTLRRMAAEIVGCTNEDVSDANGGFLLPGQKFLTNSAIIRGWFGAPAGEVTGVGVVRQEGATAALPTFWEIGMVGVGCRIDTETGVVSVEQLFTVADVGAAINPRAIEGQDLGAATQGLGCALFEELVYDGPQIQNPNIVEYRVPRMRDLAVTIDTSIAERHDGVGPFGAKGAGEGAVNPVAAAVATAVAKIVGRWPSQVPLTPERVWRLINESTDETGG